MGMWRRWSRKIKVEGVWAAIGRMLQGNHDIEPNAGLRFLVVELIKRLDIHFWLRWVFQLPLISMQATVLREIENIEEALEATRIILSLNKSEAEVRLSQRVLAVQTTVELFDRIDAQLARMSSDRWI